MHCLQQLDSNYSKQCTKYICFKVPETLDLITQTAPITIMTRSPSAGSIAAGNKRAPCGRHHGAANGYSYEPKRPAGGKNHPRYCGAKNLRRLRGQKLGRRPGRGRYSIYTNPKGTAPGYDPFRVGNPGGRLRSGGRIGLRSGRDLRNPL